MKDVLVRDATAADAGLLWEWANHPTTRQASISTDPIPWDDHADWIGRVLSDPARVLLIGEHEGQPIGSVRFDVGSDSAEVSITVAPSARGQGLAGPLLHAGLGRMRSRPVVALVRPDNERSLRLFGSWTECAPVEERGVTLRRFVCGQPTDAAGQ